MQDKYEVESKNMSERGVVMGTTGSVQQQMHAWKECYLRMNEGRGGAVSSQRLPMIHFDSNTNLQVSNFTRRSLGAHMYWASLVATTGTERTETL